MRFGSVCSGIEAASVAWNSLGWEAAWFSEIEPWPCRFLAATYPDVPNLGDMTTIAARVLTGEVDAPDVLCGGTPCQAFSVAGKRKSLEDARGNLSLTFCELADAIDDVRLARGDEPAIVFWENVPGVLSTRDNAFGCFLGQLAGEDCQLYPSGNRWPDAGCVFGPKRAIAWRVLDAQYFGLAQRRKRVFVVASARNGFNPAAVLFESEGVRRDFAPMRKEEEDIAACLGAGAASTGSPNIGNGQGNVVVGTLTARGPQSFGLPEIREGHIRLHKSIGALNTATGFASVDGAAQGHVQANDGMARRITPLECERLQGFPDNYTSMIVDGPRYKALGNSWAVPVVRWIGRRIAGAV